MSSKGVPWEWYDGYLPSGPALSFDVETDWFLSKKKTNNVIQAAVSNGTDTVVAREGSMWTMLIELYARYDKKCVLVAHNGWFADVPWIRKVLKSFPFNQGETMALGYLADENQRLGLGPLCQKYLGVEDWKYGIEASPDSDEFAEYNAEDALRTMQLYDRLTVLLGERSKLVDRIILPGMQALDACSQRGIYISPEAVRVAEEFYGTRISELRKRLADEFGIDNPRQRKVVGERLLEEGHRLAKTGKSQQPSTSKATLGRLKETPLVSSLKKLWVFDKANGAYVKRYGLISRTGDGRSHAPYSIIRADKEKNKDASGGTVTGRTSSPDQQLPRDPILRAFFSAPPGFKLVSADYSAVEYRVAAWVAGETGIIRRYRESPGFDPHTWVASIIYRKPESEVTKDERQIAKSANFSLLYMSQPQTLVEYIHKTTGRVLPLEDAVRIYNLWHATNPGFKGWYLRTWEFIKEHGYAESVTGRRRHFGTPRDIVRMPRWKRAASLREGVNFQVQSLAADIALIGLRACQEHGLPINGFVHDSITFELEEDMVHDSLTNSLIHKCMVDIPPQYLKEHFGVDFDMPLQIEVK